VKAFPLDTTFLSEQYEALRKEALEPNQTGRRGHGLALFLSRGMIAWMLALRALMPRPARTSEARLTAYQDLPSGVRSDLTLVLADMVLACSLEAGR
jgi:hypothetical protein